MTRLPGFGKALALLCILTCLIYPPELRGEDAGAQESASTAMPFSLSPAQAADRAPQEETAAAKPLAIPGQAKVAPLSGRQKWDYYLKSTYGPVSAGFSMASSGIQQAIPSVPEWGGGMEGYSKRLGSSFGRKAINRSIRIGLNGLLREDPRYLASGRTGAWNRAFYAVGQTFLVHKDSGGKRIAYSRFAGNFGAAYVSRQWYPDSYQTRRDYLVSGFRSLGIDAARNLLEEFLPDLKRLIRR